MSFQYAAGAAANAAAWFAAFEIFLQQVGWTIEQGAGTNDLRIRSLGEAQNYTMLYAHVWEWAPNAIRIEVMNDLPGTQITNELGQLQFGAGACNYWMNGDMELINVCFFNAALQWSLISFGCTYPFALAPTDETYTMVASNGIGRGSILRNHDDVWDVDINFFEHPQCNLLLACPADGSVSFMGLFANDGNECAGQIPHISGDLNNAHLVNTVITTLGSGTRTTTWIVLQDWFNDRFALRTGGDNPIGIEEGNFQFAAGVANTPQEFLETTIPAFMVGLGWTNLGDPGLHTFGRLYFSTGENGTEQLFIIFAWLAAGNDLFYGYAQDDALGTNRTTGVTVGLDISLFPCNYWIAGDRDSVIIAAAEVGTDTEHIFLGKVIPASPNAGGSPMQVIAYGSNPQSCRLLQDHSGLFNQAINIEDAAAQLDGSSPNLFDDLTYVIWPSPALDPFGAGRDFIGDCKYYYRADGCINPGDHIPVMDRDYMAFEAANINTWVMRTN